MAKNIRDFIIENVEKKLIKRDLFIGSEVDKSYLDPLVKAWNEYGIRKRDIILLSIVIAHKYTDQIKKNKIIDNEKIVKSGRPVDMGRLSDFTDEELTFLISILISKYGIDDTIDDIGNKWEHLRVMAEQGIRILYYKIYKEKIVPTEIFNTIFNLDKELIR